MYGQYCVIKRGPSTPNGAPPSEVFVSPLGVCMVLSPRSFDTFAQLLLNQILVAYLASLSRLGRALQMNQVPEETCQSMGKPL